jgi:hypothetical protein
MRGVIPGRRRRWRALLLDVADNELERRRQALVRCTDDLNVDMRSQRAGDIQWSRAALAQCEEGQRSKVSKNYAVMNDSILLK